LRPPNCLVTKLLSEKVSIGAKARQIAIALGRGQGLLARIAERTADASQPRLVPKRGLGASAAIWRDTSPCAHTIHEIALACGVGYGVRTEAKIAHGRTHVQMLIRLPAGGCQRLI
jgi:hypothetical protein